VVSMLAAYPTRQKMRQTKNMAPGTMPRASGLRGEDAKKQCEEFCDILYCEQSTRLLGKNISLLGLAAKRTRVL